MNGSGNKSEQPASNWRFKSGVALFVLSIAVPLIGIPIVTSLGVSAAITASVCGVLLVGAEIMGILAVAVMGKEGPAPNSFVSFRKYGYFVVRYD